ATRPDGRANAENVGQEPAARFRPFRRLGRARVLIRRVLDLLALRARFRSRRLAFIEHRADDSPDLLWAGLELFVLDADGAQMALELRRRAGPSSRRSGT